MHPTVRVVHVTRAEWGLGVVVKIVVHSIPRKTTRISRIIPIPITQTGGRRHSRIQALVRCNGFWNGQIGSISHRPVGSIPRSVDAAAFDVDAVAAASTAAAAETAAAVAG